jgi:hypothetical protein
MPFWNFISILFIFLFYFIFFWGFFWGFKVFVFLDFSWICSPFLFFISFL